MNDSKSKIKEIAEIRLYQDNKPYRDLDGESLDTTYYLPQDWSQFRKDLETWKNGKHTHTIRVRIGKIDEEGVEFEVNRDEQAEQKDTECDHDWKTFGPAEDREGDHTLCVKCGLIEKDAEKGKAK